MTKWLMFGSIGYFQLRIHPKCVNSNSLLIIYQMGILDLIVLDSNFDQIRDIETSISTTKDKYPRIHFNSRQRNYNILFLNFSKYDNFTLG